MDVLEARVVKAERKYDSNTTEVTLRGANLEWGGMKTSYFSIPFLVNLKPGDTIALKDGEVRGSRAGPIIESYSKVTIYRGNGKTRDEMLQYDAKDASLLFDIKGRIEDALEEAGKGKRSTG